MTATAKRTTAATASETPAYAPIAGADGTPRFDDADFAIAVPNPGRPLCPDTGQALPVRDLHDARRLVVVRRQHLQMIAPEAAATLAPQMSALLEQLPDEERYGHPSPEALDAAPALANWSPLVARFNAAAGVLGTISGLPGDRVVRWKPLRPFARNGTANYSILGEKGLAAYPAIAKLVDLFYGDLPREPRREIPPAVQTALRARAEEHANFQREARQITALAADLASVSPAERRTLTHRAMIDQLHALTRALHERTWKLSRGNFGGGEIPAAYLAEGQ